jgi:chloramphenicol 3-O-phosphotransferase
MCIWGEIHGPREGVEARSRRVVRQAGEHLGSGSERERGERKIGEAKLDYETTHTFGIYDFEVNS